MLNIILSLIFCRDVCALAEVSPEVLAEVLRKWNGQHTWYLAQETLPLVLASRYIRKGAGGGRDLRKKKRSFKCGEYILAYLFSGHVAHNY